MKEKDSSASRDSRGGRIWRRVIKIRRRKRSFKECKRGMETFKINGKEVAKFLRYVLRCDEFIPKGNC